MTPQELRQATKLQSSLETLETQLKQVRGNAPTITYPSADPDKQFVVYLTGQAADKVHAQVIQYLTDCIASIKLQLEKLGVES